MKRLAIAAAVAASIIASPTSAETIDFTGISPGFQSSPLVIGNASFSASGVGLYVADFGNGSGNSICSTPTGAFCDGALNVNFSTAVNGLSFLYGGVDSPASNISVLLSYFGGGSALFNFTPINNNGTIDLSGFDNIVGATINTTDGAGLFYDNFTFALAAGVPEPAAWAMMIFGFGAVGSSLRRRKPRVALSFA